MAGVSQTVVGEEEGSKRQKKSNENDTVNKNCDLSDYLIAVNKTNRSVEAGAKEVRKEAVMAQMVQRETVEDEYVVEDDQIVGSKNSKCKQQTVEGEKHDNSDTTTTTTITTTTHGGRQVAAATAHSLMMLPTKEMQSLSESSEYIKIDELIRITKRWKEGGGVPAGVRMRLRGGGEETINNGTSAWGTPATNPSGGSWGAIGGASGTGAGQNAGGPQQQQQQQPVEFNNSSSSRMVEQEVFNSQ
ncbi:uncharacterized protein LOC131293210 [Anopheles ziemanni]|uniref:uncharacterized protein LOC131293210 n=1 Tax=Anopheles ziemanni TaxID=345580 RepID=UPI00265E395D|nr:uncharacterized protein LOC131293210 [Anopheles ziemanni]